MACLLIAPALQSSGQAPLPPISYVYDELNRLIAVIDRDNSAAAYVYDAVGNILAIERFDVAEIPGPVGITFVAPGKGKVGTAVTIYGKGFGTGAAQVNVAFNGTAATVSSVGGNRIATTVPAGATTGPIVVTVPLGSATSPKPFQVIGGSVTVSPSTAQVFAGGTQQFVATAPGGAPIAAFWDVNDVRGGNPTVGTISAEGLYTAPLSVATALTVTVTAADKDDVATTGSATATVLSPIQGTTIARAVSVQVAASRTVDRSVTTAVSLQATPATTTSKTPLVSVSVPPSATTSVTALVSVTVAPPPAVTEASAPVSVSAAPAQTSAGASLVSVSREPTVTAVVPATGSRGTVVAVTIQGVGLQGAAVTFLRNNAPDATLTVSSLVVDSTGTQLTAAVSIDSGSPAGGRVVGITTPAGVSTAVGTGNNVFTVQ